MKPIKIEAKNADAIESALKAINGKAERHAYTTFRDIEVLAKYAEKKLLGLVLKKDASGATYSETSGGRVPNSYMQCRQATTVSMIRKSAGWYLVGIRATTIYREGGGDGLLTLTKEQSDAAVAIFKNQFSTEA